MTATLPDLLADRPRAIDFADAPCIGGWAWFDPPNDHEPTASVQSRHEAAVHVCGTCSSPTFARCADTARGLPKAHRRGVWARRNYDLPTRKVSHDDDTRAAQHYRAEASRQDTDPHPTAHASTDTLRRARLRSPDPRYLLPHPRAASHR